MSLLDRVVVLDFDGVVWDSVDESFEQAWLAWLEIGSGLALHKDEAREAFRQARWQCRDGYDFYLVMALLVQGHTDVGSMEAADFRRHRDALAGPEEADAFVRAFYQSRNRMREEHFEYWCSLQSPFPAVVEQVALMRDEARGVAIATTKDEASARALLEHAGIHDLPIYGREVSLDKRDHMRAIGEQYGVAPSSMAFVDDLLENLANVSDLGLRLVLADWGYNTPQERARASECGIVVASLGNFAQRMRGLWR